MTWICMRQLVLFHLTMEVPLKSGQTCFKKLTRGKPTYSNDRPRAIDLHSLTCLSTFLTTWSSRLKTSKIRSENAWIRFSTIRSQTSRKWSRSRRKEVGTSLSNRVRTLICELSSNSKINMAQTVDALIKTGWTTEMEVVKMSCTSPWLRTRWMLKNWARSRPAWEICPRMSCARWKWRTMVQMTTDQLCSVLKIKMKAWCMILMKIIWKIVPLHHSQRHRERHKMCTTMMLMPITLLDPVTPSVKNLLATTWKVLIRAKRLEFLLALNSISILTHPLMRMKIKIMSLTTPLRQMRTHLNS